jgi:hypothetical protein
VARVFVSYASEDRECAGQLHQWLVVDSTAGRAALVAALRRIDAAGGPTARAFLRANIRRDSFRRKRAVTILSVLLVIALILAWPASRERALVERLIHRHAREPFAGR